MACLLPLVLLMLACVARSGGKENNFTTMNPFDNETHSPMVNLIASLLEELPLVA